MLWTFEYVLGQLVEAHYVVLVNVHLGDGSIELAMMLTKILMCHVYF